MRARFRIALAFFATLALLATACGGGGTPEGGALRGTTITFSVSLEEGERAAIQDLLQQFSDRTGARVNLTSITSADLPQKLRVDVGAGRLTVHLFAQDNLALRVLVDDDLVEDLSEVQIPDGVLPAMVPQQFDGKQYFLPFRPNVRPAYANNDRFQAAGVQPPTTVEELRAAAEKFRSTAGSGKVTLSLAEGDPAAVTISEWIVSYGGNPVILNDEGSVRAFEFLQGLWRDGLLARESLQGKFDTEVDYIIGETAWLAQNWPFTSKRLADQGLLERFTVYEGWRGPARAAHVIGGDVLGIPRGVSGSQRDAAVQLAEFLMSKQAQEFLAQENAWPSVRSDAYSEVPDEQRDTFTAINRALENGWYRPNVRYWSDVSDAMNDGVRRIVQGGEPAKAVLDELNARVAAAAQAKGEQYPPRA